MKFSQAALTRLAEAESDGRVAAAQPIRAGREGQEWGAEVMQFFTLFFREQTISN